MRAICLLEPGTVTQLPMDEPICGPSDVVVQMRAVGLCGSDLTVYAGYRDVPQYPWVLGHEGGGTIVQVGANVSDRSVGQVVVIEPNIPCFGCSWCTEGRTSVCPNRQSLGMSAPGIMAERVAVPAQMTWPVPGDWSPVELATLEPFAVAVAAARRSGITTGHEALVVGAGSLGLQLCRALLAIGAAPHVIDVDEERVNAAELLGVRRAAPAQQYPFVFETAGVPDAFRTSISVLARGGTLTLMGLSHNPIEFCSLELVRRGQRLLGSIIYDHPVDFHSAIELHTTNRSAPLSATLGVSPDDAASAFRLARATPRKTWIDMAAWAL